MRRLIMSWIISTLVLFSAAASAENINLLTLLGSGGTITLNAANTYYTPYEYNIPANAHIIGNGAHISIQGGPVKSNVTGRLLKIENCVIASTSAWCALGATNGGILELTDVEVSSPGGAAAYVKDSTGRFTRTTFRNGTFGLQSGGVCSITLTDSSMSNCGLSYYQVQGSCAWNGGTVIQPGGSAVTFHESVAVNVSGITITMTQNGSLAVQYSGTSQGSFLNSTITGVSHGIYVQHGTVLVDHCNLSCPFPWKGGAGPGVACTGSGDITVRNTVFTGFENAVQVSKQTPPGTALVEDCTFNNVEVSCLSCGGASNIMFRRNNCLTPKQDSVYLMESSGIIEDNLFVGTLNTCVALLNCTDSIIIRNNHFEAAVDQSVAVVEGSRNVLITRNTLMSGIIANIFVDPTSKATSTENIMYNPPDTNVRVHGGELYSFANLNAEAPFGCEVRQGGILKSRLDRFANIQNDALLNYENGQGNLICDEFYNNGNADSIHYSIYNNSGGVITGQGNNFGPKGSRALYNNAGNTIAGTNWYWGDAGGPKVSGSGPGAILSWNTANSSNITYSPWSTTPPVVSDHISNVSLSPGEAWGWRTNFYNVKINFEIKNDSPAITGQICGALQCYKTDLIASEEKFPADYLPGHLYAVWVSHHLARASKKIILTFHYNPTGVTGPLALYQRSEKGEYLNVAAIHNPGAATLTYTPASPYDARGTFILVKGQSIQPALVVITPYKDVFAAACEGVAPFKTPARWGWPGFRYDPVNYFYPVAGDFDGDGVKDLAQVTPYGDVWVARNTGSAIANPTRWGWLGFRYDERSGYDCYLPLTGDFNGDGKCDLAQVTPYGDVWVALSNGISFNSAVRWGWIGFRFHRGEPGKPGALPMAGDFNGDGKCDLVMVTQYTDVWVSLSNGSGFASSSRWGWLGFVYMPFDRKCPLAGDFNGDGKCDLAQTTPSGDVWVSFSSGTAFGNTSRWGWLGFRYDEAAGLYPIVADVNADLKADLIQITPTGDPWVALSTGTSFGPSSRWGWLGFIYSRTIGYLPMFLGI